MAAGDRSRHVKLDQPPLVALFIEKHEREELNASGYKKVADYRLRESALWTTFYDHPHSLTELVSHQSMRELFRTSRKTEVMEYIKRLLVADQIANRVWVIYDFSRTTLPELPGGPNEIRGFMKGYLVARGNDMGTLPLPGE